jgi:hypothetical protein
LQARLDDPNQLEAFQQIELYPHAIPAASWQGQRSVTQKKTPDLPDGQILH